MALVEIGGVIAEELHGVAALDEGEALCQQPFELNRADFRAVLLLLAALLGALVVVELAGHPAGGAMEQVDGGPQRRTAGSGYFASRCKAGAPRGLPREASGGGK